MLEVFFDNEKSFSVLKILLEADDFLTPADIGERINITPNKLSNILKNFEILGIVNVQKLILYSINLESPIVLGIAHLDELVCNYIGHYTSDKKKENGNFQNALADVSYEEMSLKDFVEMLKKI